MTEQNIVKMNTVEFRTFYGNITLTLFHIVQDPHSESEIDAKIQQQLVFKFYISEL